MLITENAAGGIKEEIRKDGWASAQSPLLKEALRLSLINSLYLYIEWYAKTYNMENNSRELDVLQINSKRIHHQSVELAIKQFGRPSAAANVEVIVQKKEASVVIGAKIFISAEMTKCILLLTECRPLRKGQQA
jgi:hypothetical protein